MEKTPWWNGLLLTQQHKGANIENIVFRSNRKLSFCLPFGFLVWFDLKERYVIFIWNWRVRYAAVLRRIYSCVLKGFHPHILYTLLWSFLTIFNHTSYQSIMILRQFSNKTYIGNIWTILLKYKIRGVILLWHDGKPPLSLCNTVLIDTLLSNYHECWEAIKLK